jgi:hypothetical protein
MAPQATNWSELFGVSKEALAAEHALLARLIDNDPAAIAEVVGRARALAQTISWDAFVSAPTPVLVPAPVAAAARTAADDEFGDDGQQTTYEPKPSLPYVPAPQEMFVKGQPTIIGIGLEPEPPAPAVDAANDDAQVIDADEMTMELEEIEVVADGFDEVSHNDKTRNGFDQVSHTDKTKNYADDFDAVSAADKTATVTPEAASAAAEAQPKKPGLLKRIFRLSKEPPGGGEST